MKQIILIVALTLVLAMPSAGRTVKVSEPGSLASRLAGKLLKVDELVVEGAVNQADFKTMARMAKEGKLRKIDLSRASIWKSGDDALEDYGVVPSRVFQGAPVEEITFGDVSYVCGGSCFYRCPNLRRVVFNGTLGHIDGGPAFGDCPELEEIVFNGPVMSTGGPGPDPEDAAPVDGPAEQAEETVTAPAGETGSAGRSFSGMLDDADSAASAGSAEDAPGQEDGEQNKPRKKHRIWIPILLILLLIGAAAGGYMYGVYYFRDRFIYNTKINGVVCGRLTPAETAERIGFRMEKYQMEITFRDDQKQTIKAAQIDYKFAPGDSIEKLLAKQDPYKWPLGIFQPVEYNVEEKTEYNHERATKLIEGFDQMKEENMVKPENAYMVLKDEGFSIVPEVEGNAVNTEPVTAAILAALDEDAASVNVEEIEGAYKEPSIRADNKELNEEADKLNGYIGADITYIVPEGDEEMRLNAKTLQTWLSVDDDGHYYKDEEVGRIISGTMWTRSL